LNSVREDCIHHLLVFSIVPELTFDISLLCVNFPHSISPFCSYYSPFCPSLSAQLYRVSCLAHTRLVHPILVSLELSTFTHCRNALCNLVLDLWGLAYAWLIYSCSSAFPVGRQYHVRKGTLPPFAQPEALICGRTQSLPLCEC
jgi:hypothetical protein